MNATAERLPQEGKPVLGWNGSAWLSLYQRGDLWYRAEQPYSTYGQLGCITHWMEFPPQPEDTVANAISSAPPELQRVLGWTGRRWIIAYYRDHTWYWHHPPFVTRDEPIDIYTWQPLPPDPDPQFPPDKVARLRALTQRPEPPLDFKEIPNLVKTNLARLRCTCGDDAERHDLQTGECLDCVCEKFLLAELKAEPPSLVGMPEAQLRWRYQNDSTFHKLTDSLLGLLDSGVIDPGEIEQALQCAELIWRTSIRKEIHEEGK